MVNAIESIINLMSGIVSELDKVSFQAFGFPITLVDIFVGFIAMSIIIGVFWKGARG